MFTHYHSLSAQIDLIQKAMKNAGVWSDSAPSWVQAYDQGPIPDIWQWMQYIYLPMRLAGTYEHLEYLAPKLYDYIKNNPVYTPILQLTIELDALTPTFQKSKM